MFKEIIQALSKMGIPYLDMEMYFDRGHSTIYGWSRGVKPKKITPAQLYESIDQCRRLHLKLGYDEFIKQLFHFSGLPEAKKRSLMKAYAGRRELADPASDTGYREFLMELILPEDDGSDTAKKPREAAKKDSSLQNADIDALLAELHTLHETIDRIERILLEKAA